VKWPDRLARPVRMVEAASRAVRSSAVRGARRAGEEARRFRELILAGRRLPARCGPRLRATGRRLAGGLGRVEHRLRSGLRTARERVVALAAGASRAGRRVLAECGPPLRAAGRRLAEGGRRAALTLGRSVTIAAASAAATASAMARRLAPPLTRAGRQVAALARQAVVLLPGTVLTVARAVGRLGAGPALAACPLVWVGAALPGTLGAAQLLHCCLGLTGATLAAWLAGACLALMGDRESGGRRRVAVAGVLGAGLLGCSFVLGERLAGMGWWLLGPAGVIAVALWGSRRLPEAHLAWAGALAPLPVVGWAAAGGLGFPPPPLLGWAALWVGGCALLWGRAGPGAGLALGLARLCHLACPFVLLGLLRWHPLGLVFVAGVVAANLACHAPYLWAAKDGFPRRWGLVLGLTVGGLVLTAALLLDGMGLPL